MPPVSRVRVLCCSIAAAAVVLAPIRSRPELPELPEPFVHATVLLVHATVHHPVFGSFLSTR